MRFRDLEIGQEFRFVQLSMAGYGTCVRTGPGTYTGGAVRDGYLSKHERIVEVVPEGEPPSAIAAARGAFRLLDDFTVTAEEARARRARDECGLQEAVRRIKAEKIINGLDVLQERLRDHPTLDRDDVIHDLIEVVKGIFK